MTKGGLRSKVGKYGFKRGSGNKPITITLNGFDADREYPLWLNRKNGTAYYLIPCLFSKDVSVGIVKDTHGHYLLSKSAIDSFFAEYDLFEGEDVNPSFITWYNAKERSYYFQYIKGEKMR